MRNGVIGAAVAGAILISGYALLNDSGSSEVPEVREKWQAAYYPDGCLGCTDKWISSPFFDTVNECINWVHSKAETRKNSSDAAECSFDCKKNYDLGGISVCKETVDVLGKPSL